jgi:hypothetical protein
MLTPEQARELLIQHTIKDAENQQLEAITWLDARLRPAAYILLNRDTNGETILGQPTYWTRRRELGRFLRALDEFGEAERVTLFRVFFPTLAPLIEQTGSGSSKHPTNAVMCEKLFALPTPPASPSIHG